LAKKSCKGLFSFGRFVVGGDEANLRYTTPNAFCQAFSVKKIFLSFFLKSIDYPIESAIIDSVRKVRKMYELTDDEIAEILAEIDEVEKNIENIKIMLDKLKLS
jgi:hypothetical protein